MMEMSLRELRRYLDLIPELKAAESMENAIVAAWPHLTESSKRSVTLGWERQAKLIAGGTGAPRVKKEDVRAFIGAPPLKRGK